MARARSRGGGVSGEATDGNDAGKGEDEKTNILEDTPASLN